MRASFALVVGSLCYLTCLLARADDLAAEVNTASEPTTVIAPLLIDRRAAKYTREALKARVAGHVVIALTIDEEGRAKDPVIRHAMGFGLDESAIEAALGSRFQSARKDDVPIAARVLFQVEFAPPEVAPASNVPSQQPVVVRGAQESDTDLKGRAVEGRAQPTGQLQVSQGELAEDEVTVTGVKVVDKIRQSALSVQVVELDEARFASSDLGEVLARSTGVVMKRAGGVGSRTQLSIAGLGGDRVRFFIDGIPLKYTGFDFGVANVPINLIDRVEIYQGVVPIKFGADALGGAVELVTDQSLRQTKAEASYQFGSWNTHRATGSVQAANNTLGLLVRATGFADRSKNDYPVSVEVTESDGSLVPARLPLFHSAYEAGGASLTVGAVDKTWAEKLLISGFFTRHESQVQSNLMMSVPYGEVMFARESFGGNIRYSQHIGEDFYLELKGGYSQNQTTFSDLASCRYGWRGDCLVDLSPISGEVNQVPVDRNIRVRAGFIRSELEWALNHDHQLSVSIAPTIERRRGDDAEIDDDKYDPLNAVQAVDSMVSGAEWAGAFFGDRLKSTLFAKGYFQNISSEELLGTGEVSHLSRTTLQPGAGAGVRYLLSDSLYLKSSYEYATRLPSGEELFGDGRLIIKNSDLAAETSHNINLGVHEGSLPTPWGELSGHVRLYGLFVRDYINEIPESNFSQFRNIDSVRSVGVDTHLGWSDPKDIFALTARGSWQDVRNTSKAGEWDQYRGDRLPNQPYLQASGHGRIRLRHLTSAHDFAELSWWTRYTNDYFRGWESLGDPELKLKVPSQFTHSLTLSHHIEGERLALVHALDVQNITNNEAFDFYGVQKPGRSFYYKVTLEY